MEQSKKGEAIEKLKNDLSDLLDRAIELEYEIGQGKDADKISSVVAKLTDARFILSKK